MSVAIENTRISIKISKKNLAILEQLAKISGMKRNDLINDVLGEFASNMQEVVTMVGGEKKKVNAEVIARKFIRQAVTVMEKGFREMDELIDEEKERMEKEKAKGKAKVAVRQVGR